MHDDLTTFVPSNPRFTPPETRVSDAEILARQLFPDAVAISVIRSAKIRFFDCGGNFEAVYCPGCGNELDLEWWDDTMDNDVVDGGFQLSELVMPCCGRNFTLNDLRYDWAQAFGMFALEIRNANVGSLPAETVDRFAAVLGAPVRVVYSHV